MRHALLFAGLVVSLTVACNPAARCRTSNDCGGGVCSGGFCTDLPSPPTSAGGGSAPTDAGSNRLEANDFDDADAGVADGGLRPDAGQETNGRP
jgi:hypothetical protein